MDIANVAMEKQTYMIHEGFIFRADNIVHCILQAGRKKCLWGISGQTLLA